MTLFSIVLAAVIHAFGQEIINFVAGDATPGQGPGADLSGADGAELSGGGDCADRQRRAARAGNTKIPLLINGGMNILNI
jgi:Na+-driven multidrug efflux pump